MKTVTKLRKGDVVSQAFHYAGLVTYEQHSIAKVRGDRVWTEDSNQEFNRNAAGEYVYTDNNTVEPARKVLTLDGGAYARKHASDFRTEPL